MADASTLCLNGHRFSVRVAWSVPSHGTSGVGTAVPVCGDTGYFWFFDSANVELVVKVLDARAVNGHTWVFYGALTNVEYTITVTDTDTGAGQGLRQSRRERFGLSPTRRPSRTRSELRERRRGAAESGAQIERGRPPSSTRCTRP